MIETIDSASVLVHGEVEELRIDRQGNVFAARSVRHEGVIGFGDTSDRAIQDCRESLADRLRGEV